MNETKEQRNCRYCHDPFLDFSGRTDYEVYLEDAAYCGIDNKGNLEFGASFDSGCVSKSESVNINHCPMCGRKLAEAQHEQ